MKSFIKSRIVQSRASGGRIARAVLTLAFAGLFAAACDDATGPETLSTLTIAPTTATVAVTGTVQFTAAGTRAGTDVTTLIGETWSVTGGGTINSSGLFTAGTATGTSTVTVTCAGLSAVATVTVTAGPLASITVTPNPTLAIGAQQQFTAVGRDAFANVVAITPVWSTANPPGTINASTGLFTAGNTPGTYANSVRATSGSIFGTATVTVVAGPLATIVVTPDPATLLISTTQQFIAVGRDAGGNVIPITPVWTTTNPPGTINASTGLFTAGTTAGTFTNSVRATSGSIFDEATVIVTLTPPVPAPAPPPTIPAPPPPPSPPPPIPAPAATFRVLANRAVSCTAGSIIGDVGTFQATPLGSITQVTCPISGGTAQVGTTASIAAYNAFVSAYNSNATVVCGTTLTGTLAGAILAPGVYCFDAAATLTGTLTLAGPTTGVWLFKTGISGVGGLTGTNFSVVMAGGASACNVTWWSRDAATFTDSDIKGVIQTRTDITLTRGTLQGNAWSQGDVTITGTALRACDAP